MFKLVCNSGRWETLFEGATASEPLHRFSLNIAAQEGKDGQFMIKMVRSVNDPSRWGDRPRYITLITERPELAHLIVNCLKLDIGPELEAVMVADNLEQVSSDVEKIRRYCESLEQQLVAATPAPNSEANRSANPFLKYTFFTACVVLVGLIALLVRVESTKRESQQQLVALSNRVDQVQRDLLTKIEALRQSKGQKGDKGDRGDPGAVGDPKYIVIRDTAKTVGDIVLADDFDVLPDGFVRCNGDRIRKSDYPEYFSDLGLKDSSARVPNIEKAPLGKVYLIKVRK